LKNKTVYNDNGEQDIYATINGYVDIASIDISSSGIYLISAYCSINVNSDKNYQFQIVLPNTSTYTIRFNGASGGGAECTRIIGLPASTTIKAQVYCASTYPQTGKYSLILNTVKIN
jgi:hypothetical protein